MAPVVNPLRHVPCLIRGWILPRLTDFGCGSRSLHPVHGRLLERQLRQTEADKLQSSSGQAHGGVPPLKVMFGNCLVRNNGEQVNVDSLDGSPVMLYFSAHW